MQFANLLLPLTLVSSPLNKEGDLDGVQSVLCTEEEPPKRAISSVVVGVISGFLFTNVAAMEMSEGDHQPRN